MKIVRCFVKPNNTTTIICPSCKEPKTISVAAYKNKQHSIKVRCSCNEIFPIQLDFRRHYRKKTNLPGKYILPDAPEGEGINVMIINISLSGLAFMVSGQHYLKEGDNVFVEFVLNDKKKTVLRKLVEVYNVRKNVIGCQFTGKEPFEKALGFYLQR